MSDNFIYPDFFPEGHSVYSIQLWELLEDEVAEPFLDWSRSDWDWTGYNSEQRERICSMFNSRFYWRELSIIPPLRWKQRLLFKLDKELQPKYNYLYKLLDSDLNILQIESEYGKRRDVDSEFPETLLAGNSDYASYGKDSQFENVREGDVLDKINQFKNFRTVDMLMLDELECMFTDMITTNVNSI